MSILVVYQQFGISDEVRLEEQSYKTTLNNSDVESNEGYQGGNTHSIY